MQLRVKLHLEFEAFHLEFAGKMVRNLVKKQPHLLNTPGIFYR